MIYIIALRLWPVALQYKIITINSSINLNIFGSVTDISLTPDEPVFNLNLLFALACTP
jgi:hypothetical protein